MFGMLDITFCTNRTCPKSERCGRSIKRLDGGSFVVSMAGYKPEADGSCRMEMEYREYWPSREMKWLARDYNVEQGLRQELAESGSLDAERK